ncbi:hypothetical protein IIZ77_00790 [Candidatus Saccharibacteria bacterium]|nr:hypothetical protein [Candidatus Saccharibacteria bacterium]
MSIKKSLKTIAIVVGIAAAAVGSVVSAFAIRNHIAEQRWLRLCDGTTVTETCTADDGLRYVKYVYHEAEPEVTKEIIHPAEPAKTHSVHHEAVYGVKNVIKGCVKTTISYKNGTCALSQCWDGEYSGSTGRGTCSYHGGVMRRGGPWYIYEQVKYVVTPAWDEVVVDHPAKPAWTETIIVSAAKEAYIEKELAVL